MTFREFWHELTADQREAFAQRCHTSVGYLKLVAGGHKNAGESLAMHIERESAGKVAVETMCPDAPWDVIRNKRARGKSDRRSARAA